MSISNELRVGIMVFVGLVLLVLLIATMTHLTQGRHTYTFTIRLQSAQGIEQGAEVHLSGVKVGQVSNIDVDPKTHEALVTVQVQDKYPVYTGYAYSIGIGGLVGERFVDINPRQPAGKRVVAGMTVEGTPTADINTLINNANKIVSSLSTTVNSLNSFLGDKETRANLKAAALDLRKTTASSAQLMSSMNDLVRHNEGDIDTVVADLRHVASDLRTVSDTLTPQLENTKVFANLETASASTAELTKRLEHISASVDELLSNKSLGEPLKKSLQNLQQASADLRTVMANTQAASANLPQISSNLSQASAELPKITQPLSAVAPETAQNILQISRNLRQTSATIGGVAQRITNFGASLSSVTVEPEARLMVLTHGKASTRSDLNVNLYGQSTMMRLGASDIGVTNGLNVQFGNKLTKDVWFRYGIVQSAFGAGADFQPNENLRVSGEFFDPARFRGNLTLDYRLDKLGKGWWATTGWYDILNHDRFGIGVTYRP